MNINEYLDNQQHPQQNNLFPQKQHFTDTLFENSQHSCQQFKAAQVTNSQNPQIFHHLKTGEDEFVTRSEMTQLMLTIVQHYEKRISNLESDYQTIIQDMQQIMKNQLEVNNIQSETHRHGLNVLQANNNLVNQPKQSNTNEKQQVRISQNDALSTQNSESSLANPILTASQRQNQKPFIELNQNNIHLLKQMNQQSQANELSKTSPIVKQQQLNNIKGQLNEGQQENIMSNSQNFQNLVLQNDNKIQQQKFRPSSQTNVQNSACTNKISKFQNFSEIKNKISIFNMHQFQSPSGTTSYLQTQQSPGRNTTTHSEFVKQYASSPESFMESNVNANFAKEKANNGSKSISHQSISISTNDNHLYKKILSPIDDIPQTVQNAKKTQLKSQLQKLLQSNDKKEGNQINQQHQNVSLSILLEEDSNSQQLINPLNGKNQGTLTYDGRQTVYDQRYSLGVLSQKNNQNSHQISLNTQSLMKPILDKSQPQQKSTTSLNSKYSQSAQSNFNTVSNAENKQKLSKAVNQSLNNPHCMIQKNQPQKQNQNQNIKPKINIQKQLTHLQQNQSSVQNKSANIVYSSNDRSNNQAQRNTQIKSLVRKSYGNNVQKVKPNLGAHNSNTNHDSLSKLLVPTLAQDRNFKIKTPLQVSRSKTPNQTSSQNNKTQLQHAAQQKELRQSQLSTQKKCFEGLELDLPLLTNKDFLSQSKTFDQTKEPLTMRDLDIIEQSQFRTTNNQSQGTRTFDNNSVGSFNHSKKLSQHSSIIVLSSRENQQNIETDSSAVQSGSMTSRDLVQVQLIDSNSQNQKVRAAASRLHGTKAETRLNNLVQTIQKYKDEQGVRKDSNSQTRGDFSKKSDQNKDITFYNQESNQQPLVNMYQNFESQREDRLRISNDKNSKLSNNTTHSCFTAKSQRVSNNHTNLEIDQEVQLDTLDLSHGINQISNVTVVHNQSESLSNQDCEIYGLTKHMKKDSQASSSSQTKSRNYQNYQEYFSFSNLEKEIQNEHQQKDDTALLQKSHLSSKRSLVEYNNSTDSNSCSNDESRVKSLQSTQRFQSQDFQTAKRQEDEELIDRDDFENVYVSGGLQDFQKRMERSDTMIKLTRGNSETQKATTTFEHLTGDILDIIAEYLPLHDQQIPPSFTLTNSKVLNNYTIYKKENYSIQNEILVDQIAELKKELFDYFDQKLFKMSKGLSIIYYSNINSKEWSTLEELCKDKLLNLDDLTLLRVYLQLLGTKPKQQNGELQDQLHRMIADHKNRLNHIFNPELHFTFGPQILCQVGSLLQTFSLENYIINYNKGQNQQSRKIRTLQILAQIIYEALQFCKIVPNRIESDIRELERVIDLYNSYQDKLEKLANIKDNNSINQL
eukprot:403333567